MHFRRAFNSDVAGTPMIGGRVYKAALLRYREITAKNGLIEQGNLDNCKVSRMNRAPTVEVREVERNVLSRVSAAQSLGGGSGPGQHHLRRDRRASPQATNRHRAVQKSLTPLMSGSNRRRIASDGTIRHIYALSSVAFLAIVGLGLVAWIDRDPTQSRTLLGGCTICHARQAQPGGVANRDPRLTKNE
jgi:hypothetical protein